MAAIVVLAAEVQGQSSEKPVQPNEPAATTKQTEGGKSDRVFSGPKYLNLRYDEDFSYLEGEPGSSRADFFDPVKNIPFGEYWRLSVGGEFRFRLEAETNKGFGATEPAQDSFGLYRFLLHADLKYRDLFRVFAQGISAADQDRNLAPRPIDENRWDLHQLFFDVRLLGEEWPLTLRIGRQEFQYGNERYVSPLDWANVRRRFDAVKLFVRSESWDVDLWYAKPVVVQRDQRDRWDEDVDFYGLYTTYKGIPRHGLDFYFFAIDDKGERTNPNGHAGDRDIYTLGSRFWGNTDGYDYEAELSGQWGHWAGDTVQAWSLAIDGGYTFATAKWTPRLGIGFDWATGDDDPTDGKVGTFDQLFPLGHKYFGYLDLVGRQNITAVNLNVSAWPVAKTVKAAMAFHTFWLTANEDALYNAAGVAGRRDPTGDSGREVGHELDLTFLWKLDVHSSLLFGYSRFWETDFIQQTGASEDADLFYIQYALKF